jgi:Uma2 family endonuclease
VTALPAYENQPTKLLTVAEFAALPEDDLHRWELQEGILVMSPRPTLRHNNVSLELAVQIRAQLPGHLMVGQDNGVDLRLAPADEPGFVRCPDLFIIEKSTYDRINAEGGFLQPADLLLAVEIISPGSKRMDLHVKRDEYADAGIPYYWIIDLDAPVSLMACHAVGGLGYMDDGMITGTYKTTRPIPLTIDLDVLV